MNRFLDFRPAPHAAGRRSLWSPGRAFVLATVASLCVGCAAKEPTPAGLPEGVTEYSPKVDPPKNVKPARGKAVDTGSSAPSS